MAHEKIAEQVRALEDLVEQTNIAFEAGETENPHGEVLSEMTKRRLTIYEALDTAVPNWEQKNCRTRIAVRTRQLRARMAEVEMKIRDADEQERRQRQPERNTPKDRVVRKVKVNKHKFKTAHAAHHAYLYANSMVVNLMDGRHTDKLIISKLKNLI